MTQKLTRALLIAGATTLTTMAVAPAAHAGWMTGNGNPPVFSDDAACRNGMAWTYGTFLPGSWPPAQQTLTIGFHRIAIDTGPAYPAAPDPALVVSVTGSRTIPKRLLVLPSTFTQIASNVFPLDQFGRRVNKFDYSETFAITFDRTLIPWTPLRMEWREWNFREIHATYRVANCWLGRVVGRREVLVPTRDWELAVGQLKPRHWRVEDKGLVLSYDADLRHEVGETLTLDPGVE